jgi:hypothetical protein
MVKGGRWLPIWRSDGKRFIVVDGAPRTVVLDIDPETGETARS